MDTAILHPNTRGFRRFIASPIFPPGCFAVYVGLRIAVLFVGPLQQASDFGWYFRRAVGISAGAGYSENGVVTAFWPVGWPGFLGILFRITGPSALAGQLASLTLASLTFVLTAHLGALLFRDRLVGRLAVLMLAVYPNQIGYVPLLSCEIFYEFLLLLIVLLLRQERLLPALLAGLVLGLATLTKAQSLLLPPFLFLPVLAARRSWRWRRHMVGMLCVMGVTGLLVVAPWTYRNYLTLHSWIPVSTNAGWTLLTGNNPEADGDFTPNTTLAEGLNHAPATQVATDQQARSRALAWIRDHPAGFLLLLPKKLFRLWAPDGEAEWFYQLGYPHYDANWLAFRFVRVLNQGYYAGLMILALRGMVRLWRHSGELSPWASSGVCLCCHGSLIALLFSGQSRFHFDVMPFLAMYAAWELTGTARWSRSASALQPAAGENLVLTKRRTGREHAASAAT